jgi:Kef-type K+ transport system membrane component KefB
LTQVLLLLLLLVGLAQLLGWLFVKLRQPKVIGEILAGVVLGNALIGRLPFAARFIESAKHQGKVLDFVYWLGLLLLIFLAGAGTQQLFTRDERREVGWLTIVGTGLPFALGLLFAPWLIRPSLAGPNGNRISLTIILAVGVAVTSVPLVSKIFADLKILHTRFARLVLGVGVLEDIVLWLALAVATATAGSLMPSVLLRSPGLNTLVNDTKLHPSQRQLRQPHQDDTGEPRPLVGPNTLWQAELAHRSIATAITWARSMRTTA